MSDPLLIEGGCHCRAVRYELRWPQAAGDAVVPARRCGCSFCTRIDGLWTSHPEATLTITENRAQEATRYRFGTRTADFISCSRCGITPLVTCVLDGTEYAVVNVHTFDEETERRFQLHTSDTDFDGESVDERLARRKARWIGRVAWAGR